MIRNRRDVIGAALATVVAVAGLGLAAAPSAWAAGTAPRTAGDFTATGVRIHSDSFSGSPGLGEGNRGDGLTFYRATEGEYVADCGNDQWALITDNRTHVHGWVSVCFIHVNG
ncbi:hypothetical protein [Streptantibioticus silvisoli]|uniref:SH3 domain-containing protein n=1 Tax=Streptantibioticus silvisoli TaxID=2705255 RepID=A0ABT6W472_9ACTN|nr:hypothetical protein [Streptantibioticus silvisoli]MDI5964473.1 hypothetical protein [Streptantibioticus silvisoli]